MSLVTSFLKKISSYFLLVLVLNFYSGFSQDLIITGVYDGPLPGGTPKGVELYATAAIADLSAYGLGSANNGGGTDGEEYTFPSDSASAGDYIYVTTAASTDEDEFLTWFGFNADYTHSAMAINGDDAIELFYNSSVIDTYGDPDTDGTGEAWDHLDGWAYRADNTGPDASWVQNNWTYSGANATDGCSTNSGCGSTMPVKTHNKLTVSAGTETISTDKNYDVVEVTGGTLSINNDASLTVKMSFSNSGGTVNLNSNSSNFASIIVQGTSSGDIVYKRWVADEDTSGGTGWDLIGSPVAGQSISSFVSANSNIADYDVQYAIGVFSNDGTTDTAAAMYTNYTSDGTGAGNISGAGNFTAGQGYAMATDDTAADGSTMDFTGTIRTTDLTDFEIDNNTSNAANFGKFNLVANPFPSYLNANSDAHATKNFLTVNGTANLHDTYVSVYGYDGDGGFSPYNNSTGSAVYIAPGQGFFLAADFTADISFTEEMQTVSGGDDFNSQNGDVLDDVLQVSLRLYHGEEEIEETRLYFEDGLSLGLDPGYDAGAFDQNSALMTRLIEEDEGHGLAINAMSTEDMDDVVIPLEINQTAGQEFRINLHASSIGEVNIYLEDTELETLTLLNEEDFVFTPTSDLSDAGRFYIHLTADTLSNEEVNTSLLNAYKKVDNNYITIEGLATQATSTQVSLFNILGTRVMDISLDNTTNTQIISTNGLSTGIYVLKLISGQDQLTKKLIIK